jgi:hypothetical protein
MSFFEDDSVQRIFENHIRRVVGLENTEAKVMMAKYLRAKKELKNRLLITPDNTFTEARLRETLAQIDAAIQAIRASYQGDMRSAFEFMQENGVEDSVKEVNRFEKMFNGIASPLPLDAIMASVEPANYLFNQYESSMEAYNESLRSGIERELTQGLIQKKSYSQVVNDVESYMMASQWQVQRIVRTELHNIYNVAKMNGFGRIKENYIPDLKKSMVHPMDERTGEDSIALAKRNPIIDIDKPFKQKFNGKEYVFMAPPNRPNDRAILVPYRASYDK